MKLFTSNLTTVCCLVVLLAAAAPAQRDSITEAIHLAIERKELSRDQLQSVERMLKLGFSEDLFGGRPVAAAPFSAEEVVETVRALADGTRIRREERRRIQRDSQGRTRIDERREKSAGEGSGLTPEDRDPMILVRDPVRRRNYVIDPDGEIILAMAARHDEDEDDRPAAEQGEAREKEALEKHEKRSREDDDRPAGLESLGQRMIQGVEAEGTRRTQVIAAGRIGNDREIRVIYERWYSPELQVVVMTKRSDPRSGERTYRLVNIQRSEPLPTRFEPPAGYLTISGAEADERNENERNL